MDKSRIRAYVVVMPSEYVDKFKVTSDVGSWNRIVSRSVLRHIVAEIGRTNTGNSNIGRYLIKRELCCTYL